MNTHDIEAFVAVVETGSIVAAATRLHLTQPGISRRVQSLEDRLGVALLERQSKPLKPTAAGREVYQRGRRVLGSVADLLAGVEPGSEASGEFRLGVAPFLAELALTHPIDRLRTEFAKLTLRITTGWSPTLLTLLESNTIDAAAVVLPDDVMPPSTLTTHLLSHQMPVIVAHRDAGLSEGRLSLRELASQAWVLNQDGCGIRRSIRNTLDAARLPVDVAVEAFGTELQLSLVARGVGIGMVMPGALARSAFRDQLRVLQVPEFKAGVNTWLVHARAPGRLAAPIERLRLDMSEMLDAEERLLV
ncbi:transcriptional regulator, LysR family [Collimonas sp. OK307]|uniref:LysR family transcriptional regulator n=1 Tax=Collimonas sp. OK307 TaxID=1801620 RepID=UPI0008E4B43A|nr:LysR family transcriptional regulator [Collimonas sp. OK307]SFH79159.1 transcriptional regulator, LysR family [Collimonas sp. OK307]